MTKAVFFDAGHTLLYAHPDLGTVYAETTAALGLRLAPGRYVETFAPAFREASALLSASGETSDAHDYEMWKGITRRIYDRIEELRRVDFETWFQALYRRFGEAEVWRFYDDVESSLKEIRRRGIRIGVVSNWDSRLRTICDGLGLTRLVDFVVISAEVGVRKPDPRIFQVALEKAGVRPDEALHVGDLPEEDGEGARRAGVRPVLIERQKRLPGRELPSHMPVIRSLKDLLELL